LQAPSYCDKKLRKVRRLKEKIFTTRGEAVDETVVKNNTGSEMLNQLKEKFKEENLRVSEKLQILTVLPKSWTCNK
jgi:translation initiation factor RLI1